MTRLATLVVLIVSLVSVSAAQDFTGKWSGSFVVTRPDGTLDTDGIYLDLKQTKTELTGTAGPSAEKQWPLKGKIEGGKLLFEVQSDGPLIKFTLTLIDGHLKGDAAAEQEGKKLSAKVDAERVKAGV
ncbi:MAG TPA: hypothetical protein VES67_20980 [Vicinamibacterales bacterium]|nr:hypothetical protein [Vicinamibacterales bacterium]